MGSAALKPGSLPASLVAMARAEQARLFYFPPIVEEYTERRRSGGPTAQRQQP